MNSGEVVVRDRHASSWWKSVTECALAPCGESTVVACVLKTDFVGASEVAPSFTLKLPNGTKTVDVERTVLQYILLAVASEVFFSHDAIIVEVEPSSFSQCA